MKRVSIGAMVILAFLLAVPLVMLFSGSLIGSEENRGAPGRIFPRSPTLANYGQLFFEYNIGRWFFNSSFVAVAKTAGVITVAVMFAFAVAKFEFRGKKILLGVLVVGIVYGGYGTMVPMYIVCRALGLYNSYAAMIVPGLFVPVVAWFFIKYMQAIPNDLIAMGRLDGLGPFGLLRHVIVPMSISPIAGLAGMTLVASWHDYMWPMIIVRDTTIQVLMVAIREVVWLDKLAKTGSNPHLTHAGAVLVTIPGIALFLLSQKYMETGLFAKSTGGE